MRPLAQATIIVALVVSAEYTVLLGGFLLPPPRPADTIPSGSPTATVTHIVTPSGTIVPSATATQSITPTTTATAAPSPSATATPTPIPTNTPVPSPTPSPRGVSKSIEFTLGPRGSNQERVSLLRGQTLAGTFSATGEVDFALRIVSPAQQTLLQQQGANGRHRFSWRADRDGQYALVFSSTGPKPRTVSLTYTISDP